MKKTAIASLVVLASAALLATFALGRGPKLNAIFEAKATEKSFVLDAAVGSQFKNDPEVDQGVKVETGLSSPITTLFVPRDIKSLAFGGEGGRFVEAYPIANEDNPHYSLTIYINNLTHFEIDVGVENDVGVGDTYSITLLDVDGKEAGYWNSSFALDGSGNGTASIEWDKGDYGGTVVLALVQLYFKGDLESASLYVDSLSLTWNC